MSSTDNSSNNISKTKPKLIRSACVSCHDKKVRCDAHKRGFPCSNCITSQRPNCRRHEKKRHPLARSPGSFVPIRRRTESHGILGGTAAVHAAPQALVHGTTSDAATGENPETGSNLVEFLDQRDTSHHSVLRGSRLTFVGKDVSNVNFIVRQRAGDESETIYHVSSDDIASQFNPHNGDRIPKEAFVLPDPALADHLVEAYFTYINPWCPIVDEETFISQYCRGDPADPPSLLLLQVILLVGAHVSQERPDRDTLKACFFRRAKMLFDGKLEKNRDFVIQSALLLTWYSDGAEDVAANTWHWVGIAARTATGLGMHREVGTANRRMINHPDGHTWRRIWWILVQFDVTVALSYGRPQAINLDECDVKPLAASDFRGCGPGVQIEYVIKRTELCILISQILRERFGLRVSKEDRKAALGSADEALAKWCRDLPPSLQMRTSELPVWVSSLHLTYSNFLILLHRPHPRASRGSDDYGPNDSDICSTAANTVTSIFESLRSREIIKLLWISDINALFTAMVQVSVELRFSNPVLAINALRRFDSSILSLRKLAEYWINAESILRLFEESSHIQHGIRLGQASESGRTQKSDDSQYSQVTSEPNSELQRNLMIRDETSCLDVLADIGHAPSGLTPMLDANDQHADVGKDIFPTSDSSPEDFFLSADIPLENEWREIYWQEPGISGSFGDGIWGWP